MSHGVTRWQVLAVGLVPLSFPLAQLAKPSVPVPVIPVVTLASLGLVWAIRLANRLPLVARSPLMLALGLLVISSLVSTLVAADPVASIRLDGDYLLGLGLAGVTVLAVADGGAARLLTGILCLVGAGVSVEGMLTATTLKVHYGGSLVENRATGLFVQPNELGAFAAVVVMLSAALLLSVGRRHPLRWFAGVSLVVSAGAVMITLSRGAWLGLALGLIVLLVLAPTTRRPILATLGVLVAVTLSILLLAPQQSLFSIVADRAASFVDGQRNPYDDRPQIWSEALRQWDGHPWFGSGPGGYPFLASRSPSDVMWVAPDHAHNLFLTVAVEQGVLGLLALVAAVSVAVAGIAHRVRNPSVSAARLPDGDRVLLAGVASALAVVLGQGLLDYPLRNAVLATLVWLLLGLLGALLSAPHRPPRTTTAPPRSARPVSAIPHRPGVPAR
jgi:putative inorganic carbon (HCO3(-)) transporter